MIIGAGRGRDGGILQRGMAHGGGGGDGVGGYAGSQGPGDDELGGVGDEPRCSAWLMRKASKLRCPTPPPPSPLLFSVVLFSQF